jgi:hypothetical protein
MADLVGYQLGVLAQLAADGDVQVPEFVPSDRCVMVPSPCARLPIVLPSFLFLKTQQPLHAFTDLR